MNDFSSIEKKVNSDETIAIEKKVNNKKNKDTTKKAKTSKKNHGDKTIKTIVQKKKVSKVVKTKTPKTPKVKVNVINNIIPTKTLIEPTIIETYIPSTKQEGLVSNNINENTKNEAGSSNTVLYGAAALVVALVGGVTYRNQVKKNINKSKNDFNYSIPNDITYGYDNSIDYSNNMKTNGMYHNENDYLVYNNHSYGYVSNQNAYNKNLSEHRDTEVIFENEEDKANIITLPTNHAYKAVLPWNPRCVDEIQLNCGDLVCIKECYQDGYSLGRNLTTRFDGIIPTCCLANIGSIIDQEKVKQWQSIGMYSLPKRAIKPTKKAKRASRGISLLTIPDWSKKLESLKLDSPI